MGSDLEAWSDQALAIIAFDLGMPFKSLRMEGMRSDAPAVFYSLPDGTTRSACAVESAYWLEACAAVAINLAGSRARGNG